MASIFETKLSNPVNKWIEYKGGKFQFYDKELKKNVVIGDELVILPLFIHNGVTGFYEAENKGFYSNEVDSLKDTLVVKCDGKTIIEGAWNDIKDSIKSKGGKFTKVVYSLLIDNDTVELVAFKFGGAACGCWMNGVKESELNLMRVLKLEQNGTAKKGNTVYHLFKVLTGKRSDKYADLANSYGLTLQSYFNQYFNIESAEQAGVSEEVDIDTINEALADAAVTEGDDLPF